MESNLGLLFDTADFPARWHCGDWTDLQGWVHVGADTAIFLAYFAIPAVIAWFAWRRPDVHFGRLYWLFAAFIFSCGAGHLIEATLFWQPWYRFAAVSKVITATVSWATVIVAVRVMPQAMSLPGLARMNTRLEAEVATRRAAEARLAEQARELERLNTELAARNAELSQFTRMAGHDLREPLRKMRSFSDLLVEDLGDDLPDDARHDLDVIVGAAERMDEMVQALLRLTRVGARDLIRRSTSMERVARAALDGLADRVEAAGATVTVHPLPTWSVDEALAVQLVENLLGNAIKYVQGRSPEVHVRATTVEGVAAIEVVDNGIGIEADRIDEIFAPFRRLHGRTVYPGIGMGLAICRTIVERHGGHIVVHSTPGEGSAFVFTLGAVDADHASE